MNTEIQEIQLNTYPAYKDSGVEWLGEIPEYWEVKKMKSFLTVHGRIGFRGYTVNDLVEKGEGAITISPSNMGETEMVWDKVSYLSWEKYYESPEIMVEEGDLLVVKTASIGKIAYIRNLSEKATINPQILVLKNIKIHRRYFYYQLLSEVIQRQLEAEKIGSTIYTISENKILNFITLVPPITEQTTIANFLDDKCAKIDAAVEIKQQQIELLKERRQIAIHQAVTRGLDKDVPMKDSGVEWIGEIPEHWEVKKLKYATKMFRGKFTHRPRNDERLYDGEYPFFQTGDVARAGKYLSSFKQTLNEKGLRVSTLFPKGTIVITIAANIGDISILDIDACFPDSIVGFEPNNIVEKHFLYNSLLVMKEQFMRSTIKNTQMNLNVERIGSNSIGIAPLSEQKEISTYIELNSQKIDSAISIYEQEIEKLKEYKTTLINSAVTGKIKVPEID